MALTTSTMLPLGTRTPAFSLPDTTGKTVSDKDFASAKALLVMFICNHCPYVKHVRSGLAQLGKDYGARDVAIVAISSNDAKSYPDDSPEKMAVEVRDAGYTFPYLYDESQAVAQAYNAACTPDFFLFDADRRLFYRGQFDSSRPRNDDPITGADLDAAVQALLAGDPPPRDQWPSMGCNIKWKPDNEPDYFA